MIASGELGRLDTAARILTGKAGNQRFERNEASTTDNKPMKEFTASERASGLNRDDLYRLALLSFGTEWEPMILMVLAEALKGEKRAQEGSTN